MNTRAINFTRGSINNIELGDKRKLGEKTISISNLSPARISWFIRVTKNDKLNKLIEGNDRLHLAREMLKRVFCHTKSNLTYDWKYSRLNPYSPKPINLLGPNKTENDFDWEDQFDKESRREENDAIIFNKEDIPRQINRAMNIFDQELICLKQQGQLDENLEKLRILMNEVPSLEELVKAGAVYETKDPDELPVMIERAREIVNQPLRDFEHSLSHEQVYAGIRAKIASGISSLVPKKEKPLLDLYNGFKDIAARYPWATKENYQAEEEFIRSLSTAPFTEAVKILDLDMDVHGKHRASFELKDGQVIEFFERDHKFRSPYLKETDKGSFSCGDKKIGFRIYKRTMPDQSLTKASFAFVRSGESVKDISKRNFKKEAKKLDACPYKVVRLVSTNSETNAYELANGQFLKVFRHKGRDLNKNYRIESYMSYPPGKNQKRLSNEKVPTRYGTFTAKDGEKFDYVIQERLAIDETSQNSMNWTLPLAKQGYTYFSKGFGQMGFLGETPYLLDLGAYVDPREAVLTQLIVAVEDKGIDLDDIEFCGIKRNRDEGEANMLITTKEKPGVAPKMYKCYVGTRPHLLYRQPELIVSDVQEVADKWRHEQSPEEYQEIPKSQLTLILRNLQKRNKELKEQKYI